MDDAISPDDFFGGEPPQSKGFHPWTTQKRRVKEAITEMQGAFAERKRREEQRARLPVRQQVAGLLNPLQDADLGVRMGAGALNYVFSPVNTAFEEVVGRPGSTLTGGRISPAAIGDAAQIALPFVNAGAGALRTAAALRKTGMSTAEGLLRQQRAMENAQRVLRAERAAVAKAQKPVSATARAVGPVVAKFSPAAAKKQAEAQLARSTEDIPAAQSALSRETKNLPGDKPTLYEVTGDTGQGALQASLTKDNPTPFMERAGQQAAAREDALRGIQTGADPLDVAKEVQAQTSRANLAQESQVARAEADAVAAAGEVGGTRPPNEIGADIQNPMSAASRNLQNEANAAWEAVDPQRRIPSQAQAVADEARAVTSGMGRLQAPMTGEEGAIFADAQTVTNETSLRDLIDLRTRIANAMRAELNKASPTYARLSRLKAKIENNLAESMGPAAAAPEGASPLGVESDLLDEDTVAANLARAVEVWRDPESAAQSNVDDWVKAFYEKKAAEEGAPAAQQAVDDLLDARRKVAEATALTRKHGATYRTAPIKQVLAKEGVSDRFAMMAGDVPGQFFVGGDAGFETMQKGLQANPDALPLLEDYAGYTLLREAVDAKTGAIDPAKFARWQSKYSQALRAFPAETQQRFVNAADAQRVANETVAVAKDAAKAQQQGALGEVLGLNNAEDVRNLVGAKLTGRTAVADMQELSNAVVNNPNAKAGLRQALVDFIGNSVINSSGDVDLGKINRLIENRRGALGRVLSPEEIGTLERVVESLQRTRQAGANIKAFPESAKAQNTVLDAVLKHLTTAGATAGAALGYATGPLGTVLGAATGGALGAVIDAFHAQGVNNVQQLLTKMMLDPELARAALLRVTASKDGGAFDKQLLKVLSRINAVGVAGGEAAPTEVKAPDSGAISPEDFFAE